MATDGVFEAALTRVLGFEGSYANNPSDPGGETKFGISKAAYPELDIRALGRAEAVEIYRRDYWLKPGFNRLPDGIAGAVFDLGVNMGSSAAVRLLQEALNVGGRVLVEDGVLGPRTQHAAVGAPPGDLIAALRWRAVLRYLRIVEQHPTRKVFLEGWLRRACALV